MVVSFRADNQFKIPNKSTKYDKYLPLKTASLNAATMFGVGLAMDYFLVNKVFNLKTSKKQSLIINGMFGLAMGIYTYFRTKKLQKEENIKNADEYIENFVNKNP